MQLHKVKRFELNLHKYNFVTNKHADELNLFITSDWHFDNPKTNRELLFNHLEEAKRRNAYMIINGDTLCLMQGKYDPRGNKSAIRPEHNGDNYLDLVINDTAEKLKPYAHLMLQFNTGNHESSVSKRAETNVLERLVERLNSISGTNIQVGGYTGFISLSLGREKGGRCSYVIGYSHGNWGGVVTKGALSVQRYASFMAGADMIISGHTHDQWIMKFNQLRPNIQKGIVENVEQLHIKTGTYKEEFTQGVGFATEKIGMPMSLGSVFVTLFYKQGKTLQAIPEMTRIY